MGKSPGHRKWPDHKVEGKRLGGAMQVEVNGEIMADSDDVIRLREDESPDRYYFPRADIKMKSMTRSATTSECPFKGIAHYYSLTVGGKRLDDAAWTYEDPYEEHLDLKDRVAFYDDKFRDIHVRPQNQA